MKILFSLVGLLLGFANLSAEESFHIEYKNHLPKVVYDHCASSGLISEDSNTQSETADGSVLILFADIDDGKASVLIRYVSSEKEGEGAVLDLTYQHGRLTHYVTFDKEGRDYVPELPLSEKEEHRITSILLKTILPMFTNSLCGNSLQP